jgi:hypothetical protein
VRSRYRERLESGCGEPFRGTCIPRHVSVSILGVKRSKAAEEVEIDSSELNLVSEESLAAISSTGMRLRQSAAASRHGCRDEITPESTYFSSSKTYE